ncbi:FCD domain-containing protein [Sphingopyxis sp. BSNA05]|uniref:FCD domain-containing protein n=1 Tax=Sphingopyxis sp. BSNA05 TaxID=1236614 RepID=UPI0020B74880|nr:FCD domain-containing protein [Sphingopyxis sp. BSNA05]
MSALADCFKELERNEADNNFEELNRRFHDLLGWASGNPLFGLLTSTMHLLTREFSNSLGYSAQERAVQLRFCAAFSNRCALATRQLRGRR